MRKLQPIKEYRKGLILLHELGVWLILVRGLKFRVNARPTRHKLHGSMKSSQPNKAGSILVHAGGEVAA